LWGLAVLGAGARMTNLDPPSGGPVKIQIDTPAASRRPSLNSRAPPSLFRSPRPPLSPRRPAPPLNSCRRHPSPLVTPIPTPGPSQSCSTAPEAASSSPSNPLSIPKPISSTSTQTHFKSTIHLSQNQIPLRYPDSPALTPDPATSQSCGGGVRGQSSSQSAPESEVAANGKFVPAFEAPFAPRCPQIPIARVQVFRRAGRVLAIDPPPRRD
jgi:hypothetical protein